jgi:hypothetical protein
VPLIPPGVMTTESAWVVEENNGGCAFRAWYAALERSTAMCIQTGALRASPPGAWAAGTGSSMGTAYRAPATCARRASGKRLTAL